MSLLEWGEDAWDELVESWDDAMNAITITTDPTDMSDAIKCRRRLQEQHHTSLFGLYDADDSGVITPNELQKMAGELGFEVELSSAEAIGVEHFKSKVPEPPPVKMTCALACVWMLHATAALAPAASPLPAPAQVCGANSAWSLAHCEAGKLLQDQAVEKRHSVRRLLFATPPDVLLGCSPPV